MPGHLSTLNHSALHPGAATPRAAQGAGGMAAPPSEVPESESFHATFTGMKGPDGSKDAVPDREGRTAPEQQRRRVDAGDRVKDDDAPDDPGLVTDSGDADPFPTSRLDAAVTEAGAEAVPLGDTLETDAFGAGIPPSERAASRQDGVPGSSASPDGKVRPTGEVAASNGSAISWVGAQDGTARSGPTPEGVPDEATGTSRVTGDQGAIPAASNVLAPFMRGGAHAARPEAGREAAGPGETSPRPVRADAAPGAAVMQTTAPADAKAPPLVTALPGVMGEEPDRHVVPADRLILADPGGASSTPARAAVSADAGPQVARQIAAQISTAAAGGADRSIDVMLNPTELGRVRITLGPGDGGLIVNISADRPETLDMMRRHVDVLGQEFRDLGYGGTDFTFSREREADRRPDRAAPSEREALGGPPMPAPAHGTGLVTTVTVLDRLDIRL